MYNVTWIYGLTHNALDYEEGINLNTTNLVPTGKHVSALALFESVCMFLFCLPSFGAQVAAIYQYLTVSQTIQGWGSLSATNQILNHPDPI